MCGFTRCSSANLFHVLSTKWYWPMFSNLTKTHFLSVRCNKKSVRCNQRKSRSVESRSSRSVSVRWESVTWESVTCDPPAASMALHLATWRQSLVGLPITRERNWCILSDKKYCCYMWIWVPMNKQKKLFSIC